MRSRSALCTVLVVAACRQVLDLEPARLSPLPDPSGGDGATGSEGGEALPDQGGSAGSSEPVEAAAGAPDSAGAGGAPVTSSGGGGHGGAPEVPGGAGGAPAPTLCQSYCSAIEANCTGDLRQYSDQQTCLDSCALLPPGEGGDTGVDSVHCRLAEAEKAGRLEPDFYCPLAGPASSGKCGTSCQAYCDIMMGLCTSESTSGLYFYPDMESCLEDCALMPLAGDPYSAALHASGPHFECRLFHACAANIDAEYHCGHAFGDPPCNGP